MYQLLIQDEEIKDHILEFTYLHSQNHQTLVLDDWYVIQEKNNKTIIKRFSQVGNDQNDDYYENRQQDNQKTISESEIAFKIGQGKHTLEIEGGTIFINFKLSEKIYTNSHLLERFRDVWIEAENETLIKKFMVLIQEYSMIDSTQKIKIYSPSPKGFWECICRNPHRPVDTVFLNHKDLILNDLENFLKSEKDYEKYGIPYKRNYLFYGPPGNGKTSFINAIAGKYNFKIFLISISQITDELFKKLISSIRDDGILVLEDVDALFTNDKKNLTMSTVLNVLDGLARQNRIICVMTTNHFEVLTSVFKRPGRLDFLIEFKNADQQCFCDMVCYMKNDESLREKASSFFQKIEHLNPSRAIIQKFLFENRHQDCLTKEMVTKFKDMHQDYENSKEKSNLYN